VWANISDLDFDALPTLYSLWQAISVSWGLYATRYEFEAYKFVCHVNLVVSSSLAPSIHRFCIHFLLGASYGYDIRTWPNFAMGKSVKELELNLSSYTGGCPEYPFYLDSFRRAFIGLPKFGSSGD